MLLVAKGMGCINLGRFGEEVVCERTTVDRKNEERRKKASRLNTRAVI